MDASLLDNAESLWAAVAERLREALSEATFQTWFGSAEGSELNDDFFVVSVPNDFTREWIEGHFLDLLRATVKDLVGHECGVLLSVMDPLEALVAESAALPEQPALDEMEPREVRT
ncbi:MAG: DnaA N-terminal domain-containing protein, partial [Gaiellaceae bacterium]